MRSLVLLVLLLLFNVFLHAQKNYAVMVNDSKTGKPIAGASIKIMSTGQVVTTSESGNVVMLISPTDSLLITSKGYKDRKLNMERQFVALTIILDPVQPKAKSSSKLKSKKY